LSIAPIDIPSGAAAADGKKAEPQRMPQRIARHVLPTGNAIALPARRHPSQTGSHPLQLAAARRQPARQ